MKDPTQVTTNTFNIIAASYADKYFDDVSDFEHIAPFVDGIPPGGKVLEVGCGAGQFSKYLMSKGFSVIGIDISDSMLAIANTKVPQGDFRHMDMRHLQFADEWFDAIIAPYSLIHIPESQVSRTLTGFHRVLRHGGLLSILVQQGETDHYIDEPLAPGNPVFFNFFTPERMDFHLKESGFTRVSISSVESDDAYALSNTLLYVTAVKI